MAARLGVAGARDRGGCVGEGLGRREAVERRGRELTPSSGHGGHGAAQGEGRGRASCEGMGVSE